MKVYAVVILDRHVDPDVELFSHEADAIGRARALVQEYAHPDYPDDVDEVLTPAMREGDPWLYYGSWSEESDDCVFVVEREIQ